jgi:ATP-dependent 26S proteasome regulatory subunit
MINQALGPDSSIVRWLLGSYHPGHTLHSFVESADVVQPSAGHFTPPQLAAMQQAAASDAFIVLSGKDAAAQRSAMDFFATELGTSLLVLNLQAMLREGADSEESVAVFLRDAMLTGKVAALTGWDALLQDGAPPARLFENLCAHPGPVVIASAENWQPRNVDRERRLIWINFAAPTYVQRRDFLSAALIGVPSDEPLDAAALSGRFVLTTRQMTDMVASALDHAAQAGRRLTNADLFTAAREHSSPRLTTFARKLTARYDWDDLVLPEDQVARLRELLLAVRGRPQVLDEWGYGRKLAPSYGVSALFAGPPGTGKTMAAEVLARTLGLDVYKIDLSGMISKYIGETEKNLERIFTEAENSNAILFFDEADAVFGKRSEVKDAHDRYANIETSYLLQRMEAYDGVTILATNLRANLDEAFTRRLHSVVDFPFPDALQRLQIWQALFPTDTPCSDDVNLPDLARRFKIAGGSIRNVIVAAAYYAVADEGVVTMAHLLHATRRELQKLGRLTDEKDFLV